MMEYIQIVILAIIQGIAEFLPISSSGHLVLFDELLGRCGFQPLEEPLFVGIVLHLASLLAILGYYWRPVLRMVYGRDMRLFGLLVVTSIPVGIVGVAAKLFFDDILDQVFKSVPLVGAMLLVTAGLLILAQYLSSRDPRATSTSTWRTNLKTLPFWRAFWIGCIQAIAILPGISRSGSTITAGLLMGLKRNDAAAFSFLIAIPAIAGAGLVEVLKLLKTEPGSLTYGALGVGFIVCFFVSLFSLHLLIRLLRSRCIGVFVWYLIPVGILMLFL